MAAPRGNLVIADPATSWVLLIGPLVSFGIVVTTVVILTS